MERGPSGFLRLGSEGEGGGGAGRLAMFEVSKLLEVEVSAVWNPPLQIRRATWTPRVCKAMTFSAI